MPVLEAIERRFEDVCYTPDGREILRFDTVFKGIERIREAQVAQEKLDLFTVYVVPIDGFNAHEIDTIKNNMRLHVENIRTDIRPVDMIPRSGSAKFRPVVCNLSSQDKGRIRQITSSRMRRHYS